MSLLAGVTTERSDKFNDMYYQKPSWFARKYVYHDTKVRLCPEVRMSTGMIMINDVTVFAVRASGTPAQTSSSMPRQPRGEERVFAQLHKKPTFHSLETLLFLL